MTNQAKSTSRAKESFLFSVWDLMVHKDKLKLVFFTATQIALSFLDLLGIIIFGAIGALAVQGVESQKAGNRVSTVLNFLNLQNNSLRFQVTVLGALAGSLLILKTLLSVLFTRKTFYFLSNKSAMLASELSSKVLFQNYLNIKSRSSQQILYIVSDGVKNLIIGIVATLSSFVADLALLIILAVGLFVIDPIVTLGSLVLFLLIGSLLYLLLERRAEFIGAKVTELSILSNQTILEALNTFREVVVRNRQGYYTEKIKNEKSELGRFNAEWNFQPYITKYVIEAAAVFGALTLSAYEFGTKNAVHAVATLSIFLAASSRITPAALRMQQGLLLMKNSRGSAKSTLQLIHELKIETGPIYSNPSLFSFYDGFVPQIEVRSLRFKYKDSNSFELKDINLTIAPGSHVAIVGPSGSGKTTLVDLILGVLSPDDGTVLISGHDPSTAVHKWPGAISYVPQSIYISSGSVKENVGMGFPSSTITEELVWACLDIAQLSEVVSDLDNRLDSKLWENGSRLSGGQRQRLGVARALVTKPQLIVLDEATSSLDGKTESTLSQALSKHLSGRTMIIIAHRLSTVRSADKVIYVSQGRILAQGSFEEVRLQVSDFDQQAGLMGL